MNNLRQIGIALHNYHDVHTTLPGGSDYFTFNRQPWSKAILPFLELQNLYDQFNHGIALSETVNAPLCTKPLKVYICPSDPKAADPILKGRGDSCVGSNCPNPSASTMLSYPAAWVRRTATTAPSASTRSRRTPTGVAKAGASARPPADPVRPNVRGNVRPLLQGNDIRARHRRLK